MAGEGGHILQARWLEAGCAPHGTGVSDAVEIASATTSSPRSFPTIQPTSGASDRAIQSYLLGSITQSLKFTEHTLRRCPCRTRSARTGGSARPASSPQDAYVTNRPTRAFRSWCGGRHDHSTPLPLLHALEGWNERLVFDAYELGAEDVQAVIDETGVPAGWQPLIVGYDRLPEAPEGIEIPAGLGEFLATLEHRTLSAWQLTELKARLRRLYEAGPGARSRRKGRRQPRTRRGRRGPGARIPIPTETFLEELAQRLEVHPISVHWLLEELRAEGVVSPPVRKRELEDYLVITLLRMLGYRWPEQDAYEAEHGPILDPDLVDADGIIPLVPCGDEPTAEARITTRLERDVRRRGRRGVPRATSAATSGATSASWLRRDCFKRHAQRSRTGRSPGTSRAPTATSRRSSSTTGSRARRSRRSGHAMPAAGSPASAPSRPGRRSAATPRASRTSRSPIEDVELSARKLEAIERGDELRRPHPLPLEGRDRRPAVRAPTP